MALILNRLNNDLVRVCEAIVQHNDARPCRLPTQGWKKSIVEPIQEVRGREVAFFNFSTWKPAIDRNRCAHFMYYLAEYRQDSEEQT